MKISVGDLVFVHDKGFLPALIRFGQKLRYRDTPGEPWQWNHVAVLVNNLDGTTIEMGPKGVQDNNIGRVERGALCMLGLNTTQQMAVLQYLRREQQKQRRYGWWQIVSSAVKLATNGRVGLVGDGTHICSGLAGEALERAGFNFGVDAEQLTPADLAAYFEVGR